MKLFLLGALLLSTLAAQPLPVIRLHIADLDQLAKNLREKKPIPSEACHALDLWECDPTDSHRIADISLRWVQLDNDPELEAILVTQAPAENNYAAYIFDKRVTWNLVGSFFDRDWTSDGQALVRVQKLTQDSPPLVLITRDLGGSGSSIMTTEALQLSQGKLWPVITVTDKEQTTFPTPAVQTQTILSSPDRLVIHTVHEKPPRHVTQNECEVRQWNASKHVFVKAAIDQSKYCDPKSGKPIEGQAHWAGLPIYP